MPVPPTVPGLMMPLSVTAPPMVPEPPSVAPEATVTVEAVSEPLTLRMPAATDVGPV